MAIRCNNSSKDRRRHRVGTRSNAGTALIITVIAMFIVTASTTAVLYVAANALYLNNRQTSTARAFNVAESGAEVAALDLKDRPSPPTDSDPFYLFNGVPQPLDGGSYVITVYPHSSNATSFLKSYRIVSVGTVNDSTKSVEVVVKQSSFGRYAYFTDKEKSSSGSEIWWKAGEVVDGPVHSNNADGTNFNINYNGSNAPIFLDMVTAAGPSINYKPSKPTSESTFKRIFADGSKGFKLGVPAIPLPPSSDIQRNAAWGSGSGFPGTNGVYIKAGSNGGVYVRGNAGVRLQVDGSGNQQFRITQGYNVTTVTLNKASGTITSTGPVGSGSPETANSLGTGVLYCTGNITSLEGQVADNRVSGGTIGARSAFTIATDVNAGKYINITDDVYYRTRPDKTLSEGAAVNLRAGTLGLLAKDIIIDEDAPASLEIDAVMMAGSHNTTSGSFYVEGYNSKTPTGTLSILGGIIQKVRGAVGTFNSSTGTTSTGYSKDYTYDPRLAANPPPYYPTTGQYERLSWQLLPN